MQKSPLPIILSIPHGGLNVPPELTDQLAIDDVAIYNECDLWTDQLYNFSHPSLAPLIPQAYTAGTLATISNPIARCLIDANRPPEMLDNPDGPVKTRTSYGATIYQEPVSDTLKKQLFERYWCSYHDRIAAALRANVSSAKLIIDCHNMAQYGPTKYRDAGAPRPLICIANLGDEHGEVQERFGWTLCSPQLAREAVHIANDIFADMSLLQPAREPVPIATLNTPFWGSFVLAENLKSKQIENYYANKGRTLPEGIMVEVNRGLFVGNQTASTAIQPPNLARIALVRDRLYRWAVEVLKLL